MGQRCHAVLVGQVHIGLGIDQQLHDLYIQEEEEVLRLYDEGIKVTRRENVDVSVVFNIWNKEPSDEQK